MDKLLAFFAEKKAFLSGAGSLFDFAGTLNDDIVLDVSTENDEWQQVGKDLQFAIDELSWPKVAE